MYRKTVTETFNEDGALIERRTEEEEYEDTPTIIYRPVEHPYTPIPTTVPNTSPGIVTWPYTNNMSHCPCRTENGGSGVCGCVLGGTQVIC